MPYSRGNASCADIISKALAYNKGYFAINDFNKTVGLDIEALIMNPDIFERRYKSIVNFSEVKNTQITSQTVKPAFNEKNKPPKLNP